MERCYVSLETSFYYIGKDSHTHTILLLIWILLAKQQTIFRR